jgi:hypothetical protein
MVEAVDAAVGASLERTSEPSPGILTAVAGTSFDREVRISINNTPLIL